MSEYVQRKAMNFLFSTKTMASELIGTGLTTAYCIITELDGKMQIISKENQGTTVRIYLPYEFKQSS